MKIKKILAVITAMTMIMSLASTAFAAVEGGTEGSGELEFVYNANVFQVTLPTIADGDTTYDFTLDPMGAIEATEGAALDGNFTAASLYFANWTDDGNGTVDDGEIEYSNTSDAKTIINKSSFAVDVTVTATLAEGALTVGENSAVLVDESAMKTGEDAAQAELYLALTDGTNTEALADNTATLTIEDVAATADSYKVTYDEETGKYSYDLDENLTDDDFTAVEIKLTGACNDYTGWADLEGLAPTVEITWNVAPAASEALAEGDYDDRNTPAVTADIIITAGATDNKTLTVTIPEGASVSKITYGESNTTLTKTTYWTISGTTLTIKGTHLKNLAEGTYTYTITFSDATTSTFTVQVNAAEVEEPAEP